MKHLPRYAAGTALLLALTACQSDSGAPDASMELKIYAVPGKHTTQIVNALNNSLASEKAHAAVALQGKVLVYAPRQAQASIGKAIEEMAESTPDKTVDPLYRANFWTIDAQPGAGSDDPALAPLADTLKALHAAMGPQHFSLVEAVSEQSSGFGSIMTASGHTYQYDYQSRDNAKEQGIYLTLNYESHSSQASGIGALHAGLTVKPGQYVVLAQAPNAAWATGTPGATRLLVARMDAVDPAN